MLDTLDELDRRIVVAMQQDGRASWTAIAELVGSSTATVARRAQQLIADGTVRIAVIPARGALGRVDSFLVRLNCQPGTQVEVAEELAAHESVRFLTLVTGEYDIIAEIVVQGGAAHYPQLIQRLQSIEAISRWRSDLIMHVYKVGHDWSRQLLTGGIDAPPDAASAVDIPLSPWDVDADTCEPGHFDEADWRILAELRDDARASFQSVGERTGMNESSVRRRFDRMRSRDCLNVITLVSAGALGMGAETLLIVRVAPSRLQAVAGALVQYPAFRYVAAILDDNSLFCEVITTSVSALNDFISGTLAHLEGVQGWTGAMELLYLKRGFVETPWWRAQLEATPPIGDAATISGP